MQHLPTITINGNNPARLTVDDTYGDLGALITGPTDADKNLGIHTFVNGVAMEPVQIDTSTAGTHTIDYAATNSFGAATSTRTVIVDAPLNQTITKSASAATSTIASPEQATSHAASSSTSVSVATSTSEQAPAPAPVAPPAEATSTLATSNITATAATSTTP